MVAPENHGGRSAEPSRLAESVIEELWFGDEDPTRSRAEASRSLAAALAIATGLKPFPVVLQRVLGMIHDPDIPRLKVVKLIEQDPALSVRLLRVANSSIYAPKRACETVADAVLRLGNKSVAEIIAGIVVFGMFADVEGLGARVRDHSAGVGAIARVLAVEWRHDGAENVFLSALLHDVGKLLMMQAGSPRYELFSPAELAAPDAMHVLERQQTGYDHAVLGAHVIEQWQLPHDVARAVALHHQPGRAFDEGGDLGLNVALIRLADRIEAEFAAQGALSEGFAELALRDEAAQYSGFSGAVLVAMAPKLAAARAETLSVLTRR